METMFRLLLLLLLDLAMQEVVQNRPQHDDRPQLADLPGGIHEEDPYYIPDPPVPSHIHPVQQRPVTV
jgi:hypothetical protein